MIVLDQDRLLGYRLLSGVSRSSKVGGKPVLGAKVGGKPALGAKVGTKMDRAAMIGAKVGVKEV